MSLCKIGKEAEKYIHATAPATSHAILSQLSHERDDILTVKLDMFRNSSCCWFEI